MVEMDMKTTYPQSEESKDVEAGANDATAPANVVVVQYEESNHKPTGNNFPVGKDVNGRPPLPPNERRDLYFALIAFIVILVIIVTTSVLLGQKQEIQEQEQEEKESTISDQASMLFAILPDTQYYSEGAPYILQSQADFLTNWQQQQHHHIDFVLHVGDVVQSPQQEAEWQAATTVLHALSTASIPYAILPGNHDLVQSELEDAQRDAALERFWHESFGSNDTSGRNADKHQHHYYEKDPLGYSEYHVLKDPLQNDDDNTSNNNSTLQPKLLVLALDYRTSLETLQAWAIPILRQQYPGIPTVLLTHDLLIPSIKRDLPPELSSYGTFLWENLISTTNQIFWTINGHYTVDSTTESASDRLVIQNTFQEPVLFTCVNYQHLHAGGNGFMRMVQVDVQPQNNTILVEHMTFSPFVLQLYQQDNGTVINQQQDMLQRTDDREDFMVSLSTDVTKRFPNWTATSNNTNNDSVSFLQSLRDFFSQVSTRPVIPVQPVPPKDEQDYPIVEETLAHWRFDNQKNDVAATSWVVEDLSVNRNHLIPQLLLENGTILDVKEGRDVDEMLAMTISNANSSPLSASNYSLCFNNPNRDAGSFLTTIPGAPIESISLDQGYTVEAFVQLYPNWTAEVFSWTAVLSKRGEGQHIMVNDSNNVDDAATTADLNEPLAILAISASREFQWASFPDNRPTEIVSSWSSLLPTDEWIHVAAVNHNDGNSSLVTMFVNGTPARRDPVHQTPIQGIAFANTSLLNGWNIGASSYGESTSVFGGGCIGEVRIVGRALQPNEFLLARRVE